MQLGSSIKGITSGFYCWFLCDLKIPPTKTRILLGFLLLLRKGKAQHNTPAWVEGKRKPWFQERESLRQTRISITKRLQVTIPKYPNISKPKPFLPWDWRLPILYPRILGVFPLGRTWILRECFNFLTKAPGLHVSCHIIFWNRHDCMALDSPHIPMQEVSQYPTGPNSTNTDRSSHAVSV